MSETLAASATGGGPEADARILAARAVHFRHPGAAPLFQGIDFEAEAGQFVGIIGPNGSGKTTLLRLLCGTIHPDAGGVFLAGRPIRTIPPRERARLVALVPQESQILFNFSVLEVVLMGRAPRLGLLGLERPDDFAAARDALGLVDLAAEAGRPLNQLSSGERQRVLIARALAQDPRVILLDEPTAFLDLKHRLQIYEILERLNRERGITILAVSHDLNLAARYGSRLVLLHRGRVVADGGAASVLTAARIRDIYETEARVDTDPGTGAPNVVPLRPL